MTAAVDFSSHMQMADLVSKLLEDDGDDVGDIDDTDGRTHPVADSDFREPSGLLSNHNLLNDWLFGGSESSLDSQHSSRLSDWRPRAGAGLSEQIAVDRWFCSSLPGKTKNLGSSGSSPESQGSHIREPAFRRLGAFDSHDVFGRGRDNERGGTLPLGPWLAQPPPSTTIGFDKSPLNLDQKFLSTSMLDSLARQPHVDPFLRSHSPVLFDTSVPPPNLLPYKFLPPEMPFTVPPPSFTPNSYPPVDSALKHSTLPTWRTGPPPSIPVKSVPVRNSLRPGSSVDLNQRLEECRFKLNLLNSDRRKTEGELRSKFGDIQFNAYVQGQRYSSNQSSLDRLVFDFVKQHAWVAALFVGMKMINGGNQFSFRTVETLLQDWMDAIKRVERKMVQIGNFGEGYTGKHDSSFPVNYTAICESLGELGSFCQEVRTAMWSALQLTLALKNCPSKDEEDPQVSSSE